jgi:hypothetical protein
MNHVITNVLITLLLSPWHMSPAIGAPAHPRVNLSAQTRMPSQAVVERISPFDLTHLAYQGNLKDQGIPGYGALIDAISFGRVTAQTVMQAAVRANRLPAETLTDRSYRSALQAQLYNLITID